MTNLIQWAVPLLFVLFLWWFSSGLIMMLYGRSQRTIRWGFGAATVLAILSIGGLVATRHSQDPFSVYLAFACGTVLWGWLIASYYLGFITGPIPSLSANDPKVQRWSQLRGWSRFFTALRTCLYHEVASLAVILLVAVLTWSYPNRWGLWTLLSLWIMHSSGKLNVFLGVRNFHVEFLPSDLRYLGALLVRRNINWLFPFSVLGASSVALYFFYQVLAAGPAAEDAIGFFLVGLMISLGVLEHWLLVLPLPVALWGWGVRTLPEPQTVEAEIS
ncbi:MAG: putative photosynthetic complex assembly protein PuhE [Caldilineaceae bacterium]